MEMEKERVKKKKGEKGILLCGTGGREEHLTGEYVPVIIGRDNDRVASSCLWRDCRSRRRSLGHLRGWLLTSTGSNTNDPSLLRLRETGPTLCCIPARL